MGHKTRRAFLYLAAFPLLDAMVSAREIFSHAGMDLNTPDLEIDGF